MNSWIIDYHHAWLLRLVGLVLLLCTWLALQLLARQAWRLGSDLLRRLPQEIPICRHQKL